MTSDPIIFEAVIEEGRGGGALVQIPFDVEAHFGKRGQVRVRATFDDVPYRGSLAPMGGSHGLGIVKAIREKLSKSIGDSVRVSVALDTEERTVDLPPELVQLFEEKPSLRKAFESRSFTFRKEMAASVGGAKREATRSRRLAAARQKLEGGP